MSVRGRVAAGIAAFTVSVGLTLAASPWWGQVLMPPAAADADEVAGSVPDLSVVAPAAVAVAESLPAPAGAGELTRADCNVLHMVRCWEAPGDFATVNEEVLAHLGTASAATPRQTWSVEPTAVLSGHAARSSVDVDGHRVQVEVMEQVQGHTDDVTTTGMQTVIITVDPA